ncbi:MAG: phosphatidate cytidylyltransferase [Solirubrobacteraceae bacterium]|jgi:phosphatidate cytidylyltransferase|nr:phosphatidate cytidylyltransferase [Solirubrobacteraceae bacterium]
MAAGDGPRRPPPRGASDLVPRILVAIPALAFAGVIVGFGGWVWVVGLFLLGAVCLHELFEIYGFTNPSRLAGIVGLAGLLVAAQAGDADTVLLAFVACVPLVFLLCVVQPRHSGMPGVSVTMLGLTWVGLGLAHAVMLRELPHGDKIVITILVGTFVGDTAAYVGGRMFGRRRLAPGISPNKTVEGLVIGFVFGVAGVWFAGLYADWLSGGQALLLGAAVAAVAPLGDLFESYLKRDAGTKDTGRLFGAHGGALDRLDAVLFTAVAGFYVWQAML